MADMADTLPTVIDPVLASQPDALLPVGDEVLRRLITRRHPKYDDCAKHWNFMESTYNGGRDWFEKNIFRYIKEGDREFSDRRERCYRFNHSREVVDLIGKYLFKQHIQRNETDAPESIRRFWERSTKSGLGINDFARQIGKRTSIVGRVGVVVDTTASCGGTLSVADEKARGARTYAYIVGPDQLLDYSYGDDSALNWVLIREVTRDDDNPFASSGYERYRYRLWTKNAWFLFEERGEGNRKTITLTASGAHDLDEVPVVLADHTISEEGYASPSMIDDVAYLDRAVANYLSNLDAIVQDQTFSQLAMPAQNILPGEEGYSKLVEMGTKRIFLYNNEGGGAPFYLSPDVKQAELILEIVNKVISEIYHTVGLAGERTKQDNALGIDNSSGVAKAYDFERVNALLAAKAHALEVAENKIARLVAKWNGERIGDAPLVSYPDNFDTRGLYDEFDISARLMLIDAPDTVRRQQMHSVLDKLFPQLARGLRKKMEKELEAWPIAPVDDVSRVTGTADGHINAQTSISKDGNTPTPAGGEGKKPAPDNRQGQVVRDEERA
jgi:hypothetical protein